MTQFALKSGRGDGEWDLFVLENQWVMKKFNFFEKSACKDESFCATICPVFAPRCSSPHGKQNENELDL